MNDRPLPLCFVAMPFGRKAPPGRSAIDFDRVYDTIREAVSAEGLECVRADFEPSGGFIHSPMYERLIVSEYVIADLTLANANVTYEVGVRHGAGGRVTLLVCAASELKTLPFDFRPLRVIPYGLGDDGVLADEAARELAATLRDRLARARAGELPTDNPIAQILKLHPGASVDHQKTDVFLHRLRYAGAQAARIAEAIDIADQERAAEALAAIETELLGDRDAPASVEVVPQLFTALLALYLGYREKKEWDRMIALAGRLPPELRQTPVVVEQLALALNRAAEVRDALADEGTSEELRRRALRELDTLPEEQRTSETWGVLGRIYKARFGARRAAGRTREAEADLGKAIEFYERGFRADPRDTYPGVNVVTLRLHRGTAEDGSAVARLIPVVRFAVERAPAPRDRSEEYWQTATRLELAAAERDWQAASRALDELLPIEAAPWMRETTVANLRLQLGAPGTTAETASALTELVAALVPGGDVPARSEEPASS
jgi:hypothetical protein